MQYGNLEEYPEYRISAVGFKSYYVVWKLAPVIAPIATGFCLNRTMQYGNPNCDYFSRANGFCLNRTMQYGNEETICDMKRVEVV